MNERFSRVDQDNERERGKPVRAEQGERPKNVFFVGRSENTRQDPLFSSSYSSSFDSSIVSSSTAFRLPVAAPSRLCASDGDEGHG